MVGTEQAIKAIIIFISIIPFTILLWLLGNFLKNICIDIFTVIKAIFEGIMWNIDQRHGVSIRAKIRRIKRKYGRRYRWRSRARWGRG